ncbi:hypothetical protein EDC01DRAFT_690152 [Geopyxis carbonaria]|nr:hypothetical protein EDC01DRAFT_690152 [Geopyxis carbonaria]
MRALWKNKGCAHCRTESEYVIFSHHENKRYEDFEDSEIVARSDALGIKYDDQIICDDTTLLLRYNCPDENCDRACRGWPDLHRHVKQDHGRVMCDLCIRHKKAFPHEHTLFTQGELRRHERQGDDQPGSENQSGFKGHPDCGFCRQRFYSADELYEHCRDKHERCHICDRRSQGNAPQYYVNYDALENHFKQDHFMCADEECLEKKFVVFENEIDLKAHQLEQHPNGLSKSARRDARRIDISNFEEARHVQNQRDFQGNRGGRRRGGRGADGTRGHQEPEDTPVRTVQQMSRSEIAYHRQLAVQSSQSTTSRTFGGQLSDPAFAARPPQNAARPAAQSVEAPAPRPPAPPPNPPVGARAAFPPLSASAQQPSRPSEQARPTPRVAMTDEVRRLKHTAVLERASTMLRNDPMKIDLFRNDVSKFRVGSLAGNDLIDAFWSLFDVTAQDLGKLLNELAELYEDDKKKAELLKAWNNWKAINEDYPPIAGASTSASASAPGSNSSVSNASRVLKLKSSTTRSARSSTARQTAWGTAATTTTPYTSPLVAQATVPKPNPNRAGKGAVSTTPWAQSSGTPAISSAPRAVRKDEFPSLPPKKVTPGWTPVPNRRNNWDAPTPQQNAWNPGSSQEQEQVQDNEKGDGGETSSGRKKKGKQKQILFHVGL